MLPGSPPDYELSPDALIHAVDLKDRHFDSATLNNEDNNLAKAAFWKPAYATDVKRREVPYHEKMELNNETKAVLSTSHADQGRGRSLQLTTNTITLDDEGVKRAVNRLPEVHLWPTLMTEDQTRILEVAGTPEQQYNAVISNEYQQHLPRFVRRMADLERMLAVTATLFQEAAAESAANSVPLSKEQRLQIEGLNLQSLMVLKHFKDAHLEQVSMAMLKAETGVPDHVIKSISKATSEDAPAPVVGQGTETTRIAVNKHIQTERQRQRFLMSLSEAAFHTGHSTQRSTYTGRKHGRRVDNIDSDDWDEEEEEEEETTRPAQNIQRRRPTGSPRQKKKHKQNAPWVEKDYVSSNYKGKHPRTGYKKKFNKFKDKNNASAESDK